MTNRRSLTFCIVSVVTLAAACEKDNPRDMAPRLDTRNDGVQPAVIPTPATNLAGTMAISQHHHEAATGALGTGLDTRSSEGTGTTASVNEGDKREADAEFKSAPNMKVKGDAELEEVNAGVHLSIEIENAPTGLKGMHIHQTDNCSDIANKSMGDHFAPTIPKHGLPEAPEHHLGDLGNITIDKDGKGKLEITVAGANLKPGDALSFVGKSIVLHESSDKGTGPSGDSGKPIACAPIRAD